MASTPTARMGGSERRKVASTISRSEADRITIRSASGTARANASSVSAEAVVAVDADAAQALLKKSDCFKCHAID